MKTIITVIFFILFGFTAITSNAQTTAEIGNVDFYLQDKNIIINYDILKSKPSDLFTVWISVRTSEGPVNATAVSGDIGKNVSGGTGKKIVWDIMQDNFYGDEELQIEVYARPEKQARSDISVGKAILYSALLPGLGNSYIKKGGPYWLMGVVSYGSLAGSIIINQVAAGNMDDYREAATKDDRDKFFSKAESNDQISKILFITGAAIWVGDIIWTSIQGISAKKASSKKLSMSFNIIGNQNIQTPALTLRYKF